MEQQASAHWVGDGSERLEALSLDAPMHTHRAHSPVVEQPLEVLEE